MAAAPPATGSPLRLWCFIFISTLVHLFLIGSARPHPPQPFRSIGLSARLAVDASLGTGTVMVGHIPQVDKAARPYSQKRESVSSRPARRAVLIPNTDFGAHLDLNSVTNSALAKNAQGLFSLHIPATQERYFSATEVDIRAEPFADLIALEERAKLDSSALTSGRVRMRLLIDETGRVTDVEVLDASPPEILNVVVPAYILSVGFSPARINNIAVKSQKIIEFVVDPEAAP